MRTILQVVVSCRGGLALAEEAADGDSMLATLYAVAEVGSSNMVVANFERSLSELKGSSANVSKSGYYPEPGTASVELLFSEGSKLRADYWRMLKKGNAGLSSFDHDQQYGLPARIDAFHQLEQELQGKRVTDALFDAGTGDLLFSFEGDLEFRVFNFTGYEVWEIRFPNGTVEYSPYAKK